MKIKKLLAAVLCVALVATTVAFAGCSKKVKFGEIDNTSWQYNSAFNVFYKTEIAYCKNPELPRVQTFSIYVPGEYVVATDNGDGTFVCTVNEDAQVGKYTAKNAPIVIPVEAPGYTQMNPVTNFCSDCTEYTKNGCVYVRAGIRGRDSGAPAGVTDLKAVVRYLRHIDDDIAGTTDRIFAFGVSGGGAQAAILGASGNSELYKPYLKDIGAVMDESDAILGVMSWSPTTNLDVADSAYEWNMGITRATLSNEDQQISDALAREYAEYVNALGIKDLNGNELNLQESEYGMYQAGTYYDYIKSVIEDSLNSFLANTTFPTKIARPKVDPTIPVFDDTAEEAETPEGMMPEDSFDPEATTDKNGKEEETAPPTQLFDNSNQADIYAKDGVTRGESTDGVSVYGSFANAQEYIDALNKKIEWVIYDKKTNTATITSVADFVTQQKTATKGLGPFDSLDRQQAENILFGYNGSGSHFDSQLYNIVKENSKYAPAFDEDFSLKDDQKNDVVTRVNMYNPMYFIEDYYDGYDTATVAQCWRIRSGIQQSDTALCTEVNLALALNAYGKDVDFATVWGKGHVQAEVSGDADENAINWIAKSLG